MTQIANNYITLPRIRSRRCKNRWAYIGTVAAVCGILGVYGVSKVHAQIDMPTLRKDIFLNMELSYAHYKKQRRRVDTRSKSNPINALPTHFIYNHLGFIIGLCEPFDRQLVLLKFTPFGQNCRQRDCVNHRVFIVYLCI